MNRNTKKRREIQVGDKHEMVMQSSYNVIIKDQIALYLGNMPDECIVLPIEIKADFNNIPEEYHETFIQIMSARYSGSVRHDKDKEKPFQKSFKVRRRWYHFLNIFK
jgi:hypothetical protein